MMPPETHFSDYIKKNQGVDADFEDLQPVINHHMLDLRLVKSPLPILTPGKQLERERKRGSMKEWRNLKEVDGQAGEDEKEAEWDNGEGCRDRHGASPPSERDMIMEGLRECREERETEGEGEGEGVVRYDFEAMIWSRSPFHLQLNDCSLRGAQWSWWQFGCSFSFFLFFPD